MKITKCCTFSYHIVIHTVGLHQNKELIGRYLIFCRVASGFDNKCTFSLHVIYKPVAYLGTVFEVCY